MNTSLQIGMQISKESADNLQKLIETTFRVGFETHMDQKTIVKALGMIAQLLETSNNTISNCNFTGDKTVNT